MVGPFPARRIAAQIAIDGLGRRVDGHEPRLRVRGRDKTFAARALREFFIRFVEVRVAAERTAPQKLFAEILLRPADGQFGV